MLFSFTNAATVPPSFITLRQYSLDGINYTNYTVPVSVNEGDVIYVKLFGVFGDPLPSCDDCQGNHTTTDSYVYEGEFVIPDHDLDIVITLLPDFGILTDCCPDPCLDFDFYIPSIVVYADFCKMKAFGVVTSTLPPYTTVDWYLIKGSADPEFIGTGLNIQTECITGNFFLKAVFRRYSSLSEEGCGCGYGGSLCSETFREERILVPDIRPTLEYQIYSTCEDCGSCPDCISPDPDSVADVKIGISATDFFETDPGFFGAYTQDGNPYEFCDPPFEFYVTVKKIVNGITYYATVPTLTNPVLNNLFVNPYILLGTLEVNLQFTSPSFPTPEDVYGEWTLIICYKNCCTNLCCKETTFFAESPIRLVSPNCNGFMVEKCIPLDDLCSIDTELHKFVNGVDKIVYTQNNSSYPFTVSIPGDGVYYVKITEKRGLDCSNPEITTVYTIPYLSFCQVFQCLANFSSTYICIPDCDSCKQNIEFRNSGFEAAELIGWFMMLQFKIAFESRYQVAIDNNTLLTLADAESVLNKVLSVCNNCLPTPTDCGCPPVTV